MTTNDDDDDDGGLGASSPSYTNPIDINTCHASLYTQSTTQHTVPVPPQHLHQPAGATAVNSTSPAPPPPPSSLSTLWQKAQILLYNQGFRVIHQINGETNGDALPSRETLLTTLYDVVKDCTKKTDYITLMTDYKSTLERKLAQIQARSEMRIKTLEKHAHEYNTRAEQAEKASREMHEAVEQLRRAGMNADKEAKRLKAITIQQEKQLKIKSVEIERLGNHLQDVLKKESRRAQADRDAYHSIRRAYVTGRGEAGQTSSRRVAAAAGPLRQVDIVRIFENENTSLQEELAAARAEVGLLQQRLVAVQSDGSGGGGGGMTGATSTATASWHHTRQRQLECMEEQTSCLVRRAAVAEEKCALLQQEVEELRREVAARPPPQAVESLRRQLAAAKSTPTTTSTLNHSPYHHYNNNNLSPSSSLFVPRPLTAAEVLVRTRLGVDCADRLPRPVLSQLIQDACVLLRCNDPMDVCKYIADIMQKNIALVDGSGNGEDNGGGGGKRGGNMAMTTSSSSSNNSNTRPLTPKAGGVMGERSSKGKGKRFFPDFQVYVPGPGGSVRIE